MTFAEPAQPLDVQRIAGVSLDLDDTLWPIWPTIERAERALYRWLEAHAPQTAAVWAAPGMAKDFREATAKERSDLAHDMSALRRETIRAALRHAGDDQGLAEAAFEIFFAERQRVVLYDDALPALRWLSERYPLVAISNGNADIALTGVGRWFRSAFSARSFGSGKPHAPIFRAAAASIGLLPRDMLHVGDDAKLDVAGALDAGMQAAWLVRDERPWEHGARPQLIVPNLHALCMALEMPVLGARR
ncbi:MAG: HAD family hydrolase [Comamonadaceae bacterium]|nr:MAG: HAD family hydrolase [Comamonadaceae bacterium]